MSLGKVWTRDDQVGRWQRGADEVIWETQRRDGGSEGRPASLTGLEGGWGRSQSRAKHDGAQR